MSQEMQDCRGVIGAWHKVQLGLLTTYFKGCGEMHKHYSKYAVVATLFVIVAATLGTGCKAKEAKTVRL